MDEWKSGAIQAKNRSTIHHVYHGAHIETAIRIIKDDAIRSTLVEDCAVLANTRLSVTWLTPNYFSDSIYGNVQFRIPFEAILGSKEIRWLERNNDFKLTRFRFALCEPGSVLYNMSQPYDIHCDEGPLQLRSGTWFSNNQVIVELLLDDSVRRTKIDEIAFVQHYQRCRYKGNCPDHNIFDTRRKSYVLAYLLSSSNTDWNNTLVDSRIPSDSKLNPYASQAVEELWVALATTDTSWKGHTKGPGAVDIVLGACALLSNNRRNEAVSLVRQTASHADFIIALEHIVSLHFDISYHLPNI